MIDGWDASDTVSLASVGAAVIAIIVSLVTNARTLRQALRDRHLTERVTAYADFLTTQDARVDAYDRTRAALGPDFSRADPDSVVATQCRADIDSQRVSAWSVQARVQLLAPPSVRAAADAYADAITEANPMRKLPGGKAGYRGLGNDKKGLLKDAFVEAARSDIAAG